MIIADRRHHADSLVGSRGVIPCHPAVELGLGLFLGAKGTVPEGDSRSSSGR